MENNNKYTAIVLVLFLMSCASYNFTPQDIQGTYQQVENKRIELNLSERDFVLRDNFTPTHLDIELYKCCDTISYGKWKVDDGFIELSSPDQLSTFYLSMYVEEDVKPLGNSVEFIIENPIESYYDNHNETYREIYYLINATEINGGSLNQKTDLTNEISFEVSKGISSFEITIQPKYDIAIRNVARREVFTIPYTVKNPKANSFKISIPDLNYAFLTYQRFNKDYIKILSKDKLFWDNKEYTRKH
ncbi:MAG: hypothetical protein MK211_13330 [Flavobacteriales bacterium]|jgi:hypothetical protein|nr:hypothetical protein [Flavobacteriales bacterium]